MMSSGPILQGDVRAYGPGPPAQRAPSNEKKGGGERTQSPNPKSTAMSWCGPLPSGISYWGEGAGRGQFPFTF